LLAKTPQKKANWVLTPHPGEAARLLGVSSHEIQRNRLDALEKLQSNYGGVIVLKGGGTLIRTNDETHLCPYGNPGMASGGMGDVLTGVIAGLLAQGLSLEQAASSGVLLHALAGDEAAGDFPRGLLATDLLPLIRKWANP
jgi:NAD(P)H-hydrate epimerase